MECFDDHDLALQRMLDAGKYSNVHEWAHDSDYRYDDDWDVWYDEDGNAVDVYEKAVYAALEAGYETEHN
jgi:hypothetical protein